MLLENAPCDLRPQKKSINWNLSHTSREKDSVGNLAKYDRLNIDRPSFEVYRKI